MTNYPNALPELKYLNKDLVKLCEGHTHISSDKLINDLHDAYAAWVSAATLSTVSNNPVSEGVMEATIGPGALATFRICTGLFNETETDKARTILSDMFGDISLKELAEIWVPKDESR